MTLLFTLKIKQDGLCNDVIYLIDHKLKEKCIAVIYTSSHISRGERKKSNRFHAKKRKRKKEKMRPGKHTTLQTSVVLIPLSA